MGAAARRRFHEPRLTFAGVNGYILLAWIDRVALTAQMEYAILLAQRAEAILAPAYPKSRFVCEQRPDKDGTILASTNQAFRVMKERHRFERRIMYHEQHQNKEDRIETLEPAIANGWLAFNERDLPPELWTQFRQFPSADHNDAPRRCTRCLPLSYNEYRTAATQPNRRPQIAPARRREIVNTVVVASSNL